MAAASKKVVEFTYRNLTTPKVLPKRLRNSSVLWLQRAVTATMTAITSRFGVLVTGNLAFATKQ